MNTSGVIVTDIYLKPGEIFISDKPSVVKTILGSCISVTMFNSRLRIGSICHGMLPECNEMNGSNCACLKGIRYVDCSIRKMLEELHSMGILNDEIEVKLFGGADMFKTILCKPNTINVGEQNIKAAFKIMGDSNLRLVASDIGGSSGREIIFIPNTGEVFLKKLRRNQIEVPV
jgi:chemotaxis protein CheD